MARMSRFLMVVSCALLAETARAQQAPAMSLDGSPAPAAAPAPTPAPAAAPAPTPAPAATPATSPAPAAAAGDWKPMDSTRAAQPLPAQAPMSTDIQAKPVNADVPLPPPPAGTTARAADGGATAAGAAATAPPPPGEPTVKVVGDQTGVMLEAQQKLQSDEIRQRWAKRGGSITGYEAGLGASIMYLHKDMSATAGSGAYMDLSGGGLNASARVTLYNLKAPQYETRDTSWTAFKVGGGFDIAAFGVTSQFYTPIQCYAYVGCVGGLNTTSASMSQTSLVGTLGLMKAWGSFDSPDEWSGTAIGVEWAPTYTKTTVTVKGQDPTTSRAFNAAGIAVDFQSGSLKTLAASTAKPAHWKIRVFLLPPVGDVPLIMSASFNASWY